MNWIRSYTIILSILLLTGILIVQPAEEDVLIEAVKQDYKISLFGEPVPLSNPDVRERFEKQLLLSVQDRAQVVLWLKRSGRYMKLIDAILKRNNAPVDLKYIAIIESALRAHATSSKDAVGYWQFTAEAGRNNGLRIDSSIDERRNIFKSTEAAARYFKDLHNMFGSWALCAAAYNMGDDGLRTEILLQNERDYYKLYLPQETQNYVLRIACAKLILDDPAKFGFDPGEIEVYLPPAFDEVVINRQEETSITSIAEASGSHFKQIKDLNPEIRGYTLTSGWHRILVPQGQGPGFNDRLEKILAESPKPENMKIYVVRSGDNLSTIAAKFGVSLGALLIWNNLSTSDNIHPGDKLIVFKR